MKTLEKQFQRQWKWTGIIENTQNQRTMWKPEHSCKTHEKLSWKLPEKTTTGALTTSLRHIHIYISLSLSLSIYIYIYMHVYIYIYI